MAREAGVDFHTLRRALSDESVPRYATLCKLADYVGVSYAYLLTGEGDPQPPPADLTEVLERARKAREAIDALIGELERQL